MITFDLTYTYDIDATGGYLEYRHVNSNGSFSSWVTAINSIGNIQGFISPLTGSISNVQGNIGNPTEFLYNTSYQFRLRQICKDGTETYSPIDGDYYVALCPNVFLNFGEYSSTNGGYPIEATVSYTPGYSISNYIFSITDNISAPPLATFNIDVADIIAGTPYTFVFDNNNVPGGIQYTTTYYITVNIVIVLSSISIITECEASSLVAPICSTYKITTGDKWYIEWTDCNGNHLSCGNSVPYPPIIPNQTGTPFYICCIGAPKAYYCLGGVLVSPTYVGQFVNHGAQADYAGPCDPALYSYDTSVSPPLLNGFPCMSCT